VVAGEWVAVGGGGKGREWSRHIAVVRFGPMLLLSGGVALHFPICPVVVRLNFATKPTNGRIGNICILIAHIALF